MPIKDALKEIEKASSFKFFYNEDLKGLDKVVTLKTTNATIDAAMQQLLDGSNVSFEKQEGGIILLVPQKKAKTEQQSTKQINGIIKEENGESIIGASIQVKGAPTIGAVSDMDGTFSLAVPDDAILSITYIGYHPVDIKVGNQTNLEIILQKDDHLLDEIVVVGYGVQKKINLTGSVASVNFDNEVIASRPITNVSAALAGTMPGLAVRQGSGIPGADGASLRLRGVGSLNSSQDPLILIDGQPGEIGQISANDIASITALKDAASAAIYGSRASNGVILITTKTGSDMNGKVNVEYTGNVGWNKATKLPKFISNSADYMELVNQIGVNSDRTILYTDTEITEWRNNSADGLRYPNTNWWDALIDNNIIQSHQVSVRGGSKAISSYASINYQKNDGLMSNTLYEATNIRMNTDYQAYKWLKLGVNGTAMVGRNQPGDIGGALNWLWSASPAMVPISPDGRYGDGQTSTGSKNNPYWILKSIQGEKRKKRFTGKFYAIVTPFEDLAINASYFKDVYNYKENIINTDIPRWDFKLDQQTTNGSEGIITNTDSNTERTVVDLFVNYNKTFSQKHTIGVLVGYNQEYYKGWWFNARKAGLISIDTPVLSGASELQSADGGKDDFAMQSYFGRLNYDYAGKYLVEMNIRRDGSSRFAKNNRWGNFPSFSAAWRISEESFFENPKRIINNLKIRASWGRLGNNGIGNYEWQSVYSPANTSFGDYIQQGIVLNNIANRNISWEKTDVVDVGLDLTFLNDFNLVFDFYNKNTHGILFRNPIPLVNGGLGAPMMNSAKVQNRGFEGQLSYNKQFGDFSISATVNGSYNKNKILSYKGDYLEISGATVWTEGQPIGKFYIREIDHIIQSQDEVDKLISEGYSFSPSTPGPGDFLYKDLNNDKKIDDNDRVLKGQPIPLVNYGGTIAVGYKGFDFNLLFNGVAGWNRYLSSGIFSLNNASDERMLLAKYKNQWSETNKNTNIPKLYTGNEKNNQISDYYLYDASFLRIKNMQLGYTLPSSVRDRIKLNSIRVYCNLENFFTITDYPGMDPEMDGDLGYPIIKTISLGVNIKF